MSGIKIINVLKDDSLGEIMELFRQAPPGEVIFVLPRASKVFVNEDQFAAFASEAAGGDKTITLMTSNEGTAGLARKFKFTVMPAGKPVTKLASVPPPHDDDVVDTAVDGFQDDVVETSDATMNVEGQDAAGTDAQDELEGFRIVGTDGEPVDEDGDGDVDRPTAGQLQYGDLASAPAHAVQAQLAAAVDGVRRKRTAPPVPPVPPDEMTVQVRRSSADTSMQREADLQRSPAERPETAASLDYIDAVWRDKVAQQSPDLVTEPTQPVVDGWLSRIKRPSPPSTRGGRTKWFTVLVLAVAIVVLGTVVYLTSGAAVVTVMPMAKPLQYAMTVQAADTFATVDAAFGKIPGQLIEVTKTAKATIAASGQRDVASKARGKITIANEYSSTPQMLVATTRFAAPDGRVFRTLQTVTVPGSTVVQGKTVAGTATVDVIADKAGPEYNIPAGRFIVLAFQEKGDTERVQKFYGMSEQPMSGGASGPSQVVTEADYTKALEQATADVRAQMKDALTSQGADLVVLQAEHPPLSDPVSSAKPDDAAQEVTVTVTSTLRTVAFRNGDLQSLVRETIAQKERQVVLPEKLSVDFKDVSFKDDTGVLSFGVALSGTAYAPLDASQIASDIAGKDGDQVRAYFRARTDVGSASVNLTPFWVSAVPGDTKDITVDISYEGDARP